ncbi:hypothetical protein SAMN04488514_1024 [Kriegella aquimaris]|uniref:HNH endonuclease n=1 Tax=Kriegella aquimaris TaxID=192904 RepID=A0A1G9LC05_9FLAO|nr:hypothetical protein SAMN04488514_1024 [Kriegella aquimaris]
MKTDYQTLLNHPRWKTKRRKILTRDQFKCAWCDNDQNLKVHHRQYHFIISQNRHQEPWNYPDKYLITLCDSCHKEGHKTYQIPTYKI